MIANRLPPQPTPFVGRSQELAEIAALLADPDCRLLTLVGPGGIGKTRLAIEAATAQIPLHPNGVYFVPLQSLAASELIISAIADSIAFEFFGPLDPKQQLLSYLGERHMLLVLDNFEHLLDGVSLVSDLLAHTASVKVIATSREALNLQEEWLYPVKGMCSPNSGDLSAIEEYGAVQLFVQSARRIRAGFSLAEEQVGVVRICQMVEGMPLALELAAVWARAMSCQMIAREIERGLDILESPVRNVPERHRSMRAVLEHSWNLLTEAEGDVFKKLSVFRGGFTREAAEYVAGASLRTLSALLDKSWVRRVAAGRYDIHEVLRQYAAAKLSESPDESSQTQTRHCEYYAGVMAQRTEALKDRRYKEAVEQIMDDIDNLRQAWRWAVEHLRLAEFDPLWEGFLIFYAMVNWFGEGRDTFAQTQQLRTSSEEGNAIRAFGLIGLGWFAVRLGDFARASEAVSQSLAMLERPGLARPKQLIWCHQVSSFVLLALGDYETAQYHVQEGLAIADMPGDAFYAGGFHFNQGRVAYALGDYDSARSHLQEALMIAREAGLLWGVAFALNELGAVTATMGDYVETRSLLAESIGLFRESRDPWGLASSLGRLGKAVSRLGDLPEARQCFREALQVMTETPAPPVILEILTGVAVLLDKVGDHECAVALLTMALQHPASEQTIRDEAQRVLARLQTELPPEVFAAGVERGKALQPQTVIAEFLDGPELPQIHGNANQNLPEPLTQREMEILQLIAAGLSNREIADQLVVTLATVKRHINNLYGKLGVASRTRAIVEARSLNLL